MLSPSESKAWLQSALLDHNLTDALLEFEDFATECSSDEEGAEELFNEFIETIDDEDAVAFFTTNKEEALQGLLEFIEDMKMRAGEFDTEHDPELDDLDYDDSEEEESLKHLKSFERFDNLYNHPQPAWPSIKKGNISDYSVSQGMMKVLKTKPLSYWLDYANDTSANGSGSGIDITNPNDLQDEIYEIERDYAIEAGSKDTRNPDELIYWSKNANAEMKALGLLLIWATGKANTGILRAYATQYAK